MPFQGMFLTKEILQATYLKNILGYLIIMLVWGLGEGLFYVVMAKKINTLKKTAVFVCAIIAIAIHGMHYNKRMYAIFSLSGSYKAKMRNFWR